MTIQVGDVVGYVYAQPGNDTTYLLVELIEGKSMICWDLCFQMQVGFRIPDEDLELWKASERELQIQVGSGEASSSTIQQLADERRKSSPICPDP